MQTVIGKITTGFSLLVLCMLFYNATYAGAADTCPNGEGKCHKITFINNCTEPVWVGEWGIVPGKGQSGDGWEMKAKSEGKPTKATRQIPYGFVSGRWWPRTGCKFNSAGICSTAGHDCCETGGCKVSDDHFGLVCRDPGVPPASLIEATFDDPPNDPADTYDLSALDGINLPVRIAPDSGTFNKQTPHGMSDKVFCKPRGWSKGTKEICPTSLWDAEKNVCWGPCKYYTSKLKKPEGIGHNITANICCDATNIQHPPITGQSCAKGLLKGGYGCSPGEDPDHGKKGPGTDDEKCWARWPGKHGYWGDLDGQDAHWKTMGTDSLAFIDKLHETIPGVYAWQFDDMKSTYHCKKDGGHVDYTITFCPEP